MPVETSLPPTELEDALRRKVAELEATLATTATLEAVTAERDKLRRAYEQLKGHLELLRRRIFLAQAERIDTRQLELEFAATKAKLDKIAKELGSDALVSTTSDSPKTSSGDDGRPARKKKRTSKGTGRPNLRDLDLPEERVEILDPALEGTAERIGFDETCLLGHRRASAVRIVMAVATYKEVANDGSTEFKTADKPKEL